MNPRLRRHNRHARKRRAWQMFTSRLDGGTFSNLISGEPLTMEKLRAAIAEVRAYSESPYEYRIVTHHPPPVPTWLYALIKT